MFTRNKIIFIAVAGLLTLALVGCEQMANAGGGGLEAAPLVARFQTSSEPTPRTITVNGAGMATARPDVAHLQLGVETINTDAGLAVSENTTRMTAVMNVLKELGIEDSDIQTVNYSMWIEQVYDREGQPTGETRYHVVNQIRIRLRDLAQTGEVLQKALEAGANNVGGISFSVADLKALQQKARDLAIADARAKAEQLAAGLGARLGAVRQVSEYGGVVTQVAEARAVEGVGGGAVPVSGGEFSLTVEITVAFDIAE